MAAIWAAKVKECISKPPEERDDVSIRVVADWVQSRVTLLADAEYSVIRSLLKQCTLETYERDELIIREGDQGEVLYILLSGAVEIFRKNKDTDPEEFAAIREGRPDSAVASLRIQEKIWDKNVLGECVFVQSQSGSIFGERALVEDEPRSASILAAGEVDLLTIARDLYKSTIQESVERDVNLRNNYIANDVYSGNWQRRFKKQLSMAFERVDVDYDTVLFRQGDKVDKIYFILDGEVKLSCHPNSYEHQYAPGMRTDEYAAFFGYVQEQMEEDKKKLGTKETDTRRNGRKLGARASTSRRKFLDICLLEHNERVGDVEAMLNLPTSVYTAVTTKASKLFHITMKQWERLFCRRHPLTVDAMRNDLPTRLAVRTPLSYKTVAPFLYNLVKVATANAPRTRIEEAMSGGNSEEKTAAESGNSFLLLPPRGLLIDLHGPGTVFHYIRSKEQDRKLKKATQKRLEGANASIVKAPTNVSPSAVARALQNADEAEAEVFDRRGLLELLAQGGEEEDAVEDAMRKKSTLGSVEDTDAVRSDIESRLRKFLEAKCENLSQSKSSTQNYKVQVHSMVRGPSAEPLRGKGGAIAVIRQANSHPTKTREEIQMERLREKASARTNGVGP